METSANTGWARICILRSNFAVSWYIVLPLCCWCLDDADRTHEAETCDSFIGRTAWTEVFFCPVPACLLWCRDLRSVDVSCHAEVEGMPVMGYPLRNRPPEPRLSQTGVPKPFRRRKGGVNKHGSHGDCLSFGFGQGRNNDRPLSNITCMSDFPFFCAEICRVPKPGSSRVVPGCACLVPQCRPSARFTPASRRWPPTRRMRHGMDPSASGG